MLAGCLCGVILARPAVADDVVTPVHVRHVVPTHLMIKDQYFDASPAGFRSYLETIRWTNPELYAQLSPDVDHLQSRLSSAYLLMGLGFAAGLATIGLGFAMRNNCVEPSIYDPNFAADMQAWGACNSDNLEKMATFGFLGMSVVAAGLIGAWVAAPTRADLLDLVNKHNRASPEPMHFQIGYDPTHQLATAGAVLSF